MNGAIRERLRERRVDELVLLDERQARELPADDGDVEVVAAARTVDDLDDARVGEGGPQERLEHASRRRPLDVVRVRLYVVADHALRRVPLLGERAQRLWLEPVRLLERGDHLAVVVDDDAAARRARSPRAPRRCASR